MTSVFYLFRDSPQRRAALALEPRAPARYALYGMDELAERGWAVRHNLESAAPGRTQRSPARRLKRGVEAAGGYGGDFATVLASLREVESCRRRPLDRRHRRDPADAPGARARRSDAVRLRRDRAAGASRAAPAQVASNGSIAGALGAGSAVVAYSEHEAESLGAGFATVARTCPSHSSRSASTLTLSARSMRHSTSTSSPSEPTRTGTSSSCSPLPARCRKRASSSSRTPEHARSLDARPPNVSVETDLPFEQMRDRLARARVVALPVRDNSYSGATTVLLQAMALEKPVVVTRTAAIATGYGLVDGENVRLVAPGDAARPSRRAVADILGDEGARRGSANTLGGCRARATLEIGSSAELAVSSRRPGRLHARLQAAPAAAGASSPLGMRPAASRCRASSQAPHAAQGCVST